MMALTKERVKITRKQKSRIKKHIKSFKSLAIKNRRSIIIGFSVISGFFIGIEYVMPFIAEQYIKIPFYVYLVERLGHVGSIVFLISAFLFLKLGLLGKPTITQLLMNAFIGITQTFMIAALVAIYCFRINHFGEFIPQYGGIIGNDIVHAALQWSKHFSGNYVMAQIMPTTILIITGLYNGWLLPLGRLVLGIPPHVQEFHNESMEPYKSMEKPKKPAIPDEQQIERVLNESGINAGFSEKIAGNTVVQYEFNVDKNISAKKTAGDIARVLGVNMDALTFLDSVDGKPGIAAIQAPNKNRTMVKFLELLDRGYLDSSKLNLFLGKDINGNPLISDLAKMPHLLVAGTTGSGKSVAVNTMILSLLKAHTQRSLKMVMIDPKMLELAPYNDLPHLQQGRVITDMNEAGDALEQCVNEMERRYTLLASAGVRDIHSYNQQSQSPLPFMVIIIDEFADLVMTHGESVETHIMRIGQKARAAGIHMILATQRPDADVVTGLIKANIPARIAFKCVSDTNSKIILDRTGAERLLGHGDGLFIDGRSISPVRFQGAFIDDKDINKHV